MKKHLLLLATASIMLASCGSQKKITEKVMEEPELQVIEAPEIVVEAEVQKPPYQGSETRINDLIHTKLEVNFNWEKQELNGKATLDFEPYFYVTDKLTLDAKGFQINEVALVRSNGTKMPLEYHYVDYQFIDIKLDKKYKRGERYRIFVDYIAKPEELEATGSAAITSDKGLYFINADGSEPNKPKQIWTQGETEASSCWFPTIDAPNEKTTQEIQMTVNEEYVTLSNGKMVSSKSNGNGTRTDIWKQDIPHTPYLFMMFVGDMAVVKDKSWNGKEVSYYVEKDYEQYAMQIFGNTPEMLDFYSELLDYPYPWDKYSQVVVRDFVSGAMENTTATIHFDQLQRTDRELLDETHEDIVAHELIHHWFGDIVTCESWANLPLNESFATYGEYLWIEHKYGKEEADKHGFDDLQIYLQEAQGKKVELIRYHYADKEDMFDAHSYHKGGRILHMLRNHIGDDAFFEALSIYLKRHEYQAVEIHQLRLALEEVTGMDLNWFFNQWFFKAGHPIVRINHKIDEENKKYDIVFKQKQDETPYRLPLAIDIYYPNNKVERKEFTADGRESTFSFEFTEKPLFVNVDADKVMVWEKDERRDMETYVAQYEQAPLFLDRFEAIDNLSKRQSEPQNLAALVMGLNDKFWTIRAKTASSLDASKVDNYIVGELMKMAENDEKSDVRRSALNKLTEINEKGLSAFNKPEELKMKMNRLFEKATKDRAYSVAASGLKAMVSSDVEKGLALAKTFENEKSGSVIRALSSIYGENGGKETQSFFEDKLANAGDFSRYTLLQDYGKFVTRNADNSSIATKAISTLQDKAMNDGTWWVRMNGMMALAGLKGELESQKSNLESVETPDASKVSALVERITNLGEIMSQITGKETHPRLSQIYKMQGF